MSELVTLIKQDAVGIVALNNPPVNALSHALRVQLMQVFTQALADQSLQALVICCEGRTFVAGADIREFGKPPLAPDVPELVEFIDTADKPVVAAIHGTALGGGLELALACHFRVAVPTARLGFPEVNLGILPGAGGTQRLPRLIGVRAALEMIVGGQPVSASQARELGLLDELIEGDLKQGACAFAEQVLADGRPLEKLSKVMAALPEGPEFFETYRASLRDRYRGFLAPFHCVRAVQAAVELPFVAGLARERELFQELIQGPQSKAQRHIFFAEREVMKIPGLAKDIEARRMASAAVVGAGALATELVIAFADAGLPVSLLGPSPECLEAAVDAVRNHYTSALQADSVKPFEMSERLGRLRPTLSYAELGDADLVIEVIDGDLERKCEVFARLDAVCKPGAILATTTAHLDVDRIAAATHRPQDVLSMHFVRLGHSERVVENARGRDTAADAWATSMKIGRALGKLPVPLVAKAGLVADRMLVRQLSEALLLLEEGALPEQVDEALVEFGLALGPLAMADRVGLDVRWLDSLTQLGAGPGDAAEPGILERLRQLQRFGAKVHSGFFRYAPDGERAPAAEIEELLLQHSKARGVARRSIAAEEIVERCLYAMINEGARMLSEGVAARPLDIDMVSVHGCGFPAYRGGPMFYADQLGIREVHGKLLALQAGSGSERWLLASLIERLAMERQGFYASSARTP